MENTPENKEIFFALYINQKVLCDNLRRRELLHKHWNWRHSDFWLELKPLSQITDEDAIEVGKIVHEEYPSKNELKQIVLEANLNKLLKALEETPLKFSKSTEIDHTLRSKGYALPWNGITVGEQIEWGWIKLTT